MKITALPLAPDIAKLKKDLLKQAEMLAEQAGQRYCELAEKHLKRTFAHWGASGENQFGVPSVKCAYKVRVSPTRGVQLTIEIVVVDGSGQPHYLWHILSQGRREYTFPAGKKSPPIRRRKARRTRANRLDADPFPGYASEVFVIHGGKKVKGVPGRRWYEAARNEILREAKADPVLKEFKVQAFVYEVRVFQ